MTAPFEPEELRRLLDEVAAGPTTGTFDEVFRRAHRQRRSIRAGLVIATVVVVAAAIAVPTLLVSGNAPRQRVTTSQTPLPTPSTKTTARANPYGLFGHWRVAAAGERPGTVLTFGLDLILHRPCGELDGNWRADRGGDFIGAIYGGAAKCFHSSQSFSAPWLTQAAGFRISGADRLLLDADGTVLARLSPVGPEGDSHAIPAPSAFSAAQRALVETPAPLPSGVSPASLDDLLGRWHATGPNPGSPGGYVEFTNHGIWIGSDGCNGYGGRLGVGTDGQVLTTTGPNGDVECELSPAPSWVVQAGRIGIAGDQLVLFDASGKLLGRLVRQQTAHVIGRFVAYVGVNTHPQLLTGAISARLGAAQGDGVDEGSARRGHFAMTVPVGRYVFLGSTAGFPDFTCTSNHGQPTTLTAGETVHITVTCNGK
jgi:hypothetical protein